MYKHILRYKRSGDDTEIKLCSSTNKMFILENIGFFSVFINYKFIYILNLYFNETLKMPIFKKIVHKTEYGNKFSLIPLTCSLSKLLFDAAYKLKRTISKSGSVLLNFKPLFKTSTCNVTVLLPLVITDPELVDFKVRLLTAIPVQK